VVGRPSYALQDAYSAGTGGLGAGLV